MVSFQVCLGLASIEYKLLVWRLTETSSMGISLSCNPRGPRDIGSEASPGLLPLTDLMGKSYQFENLIFEGCGVKGYAYAGALKVLEKTGVLSNMKRFAGMGSGAIVACLLAAGFAPDSVQCLLDVHLQNFSSELQHTPRVRQDEMLHNFGWNDGYRLIDWLGNFLMQRFETADLTFQQLYDITGNELCIPVMNLNANKMEYFHPKTTPDFIIRRAVAIAMSIPGIYRPLKLSLNESPEDYYMDGGIICNYPIHCFDGWWLSMKPDDRFLYKCQPAIDMRTLELDCFFGFNPTSLGIMTFDDYHCDNCYVMKRRLEEADGIIAIPATELGKKYNEAQEKLKLMKQQLEIFPEANEKLRDILETLKEDNNLVSVVRLAKEVTNRIVLSTAELQALFGVGNDESDCLELLHRYANYEDKLSTSDIMSLTEKKHWQNFYAYSKMTPTSAVTNLSSFWGAVNNVSNEKNKSVSTTNMFRTIGIYTGHITNNDTSLHEADAAYLYQHGWNSTVAFLRGIPEPSTTTKRKILSSSSDTS